MQRDYDDIPRKGSNELILNPGEYAFLQDNTKGNVQTFVGPIVVTQTGQLRPIRFDQENERFTETTLQSAAVQNVSARKGEYLVLENPTKEDLGLKHPAPANNNTSAPDLRHGEKINVPGPVEFALWPQQMAETIEGHHLRPDQYLLARVYDEAAARVNWDNAIAEVDDEETVVNKAADELDLSLGKLLIIKDVSFYIPPTGVEVVADDNGEYVRDALTLEMGEYCILVDASGNKRYEPGPQIVFPAPTETFFKENGKIKFRPIELTPTQGLHLKINCDYADNKWVNEDGSTGRTFQEGDEVFITGKTHPIYYPQEEHSIVRYGDNLIHYATAVSAGQARYVMNKSTGEIVTRHGPDMILLNPIHEVFVTRVLSDAESLLMYPGNQDSLEYNRSLRQFQVDRGSDKEVLTSAALSADFAEANLGYEAIKGSLVRSAKLSAGAPALPDQMRRKTSYTKPHSVTLDDRFAGAPTLRVWTGFAVLLVKADGTRRVEVGPKVVTLDYDETVQALHLSTGKPKTTDKLLTTGYLEVANNKVSDILTIETSDGVEVSVKLSFRVTFDGEPENWFNVDNYVKFLCDHCRSLLKGEGRKITVRDFYRDPVAFIRDTILGKKSDAGRKGRPFNENGMLITDLEVLDVTISDPEIGDLLHAQQQEVITNQIAIDRSAQHLEVARAQADNEAETLKLQDEIRQLKQELELKKLADRAAIHEFNAAEALKRINEEAVEASEREHIATLRHAGTLKRQTDMVELELRQKDAETQAVIKRFEAANGELAAAIRHIGDEQLLEKVATAMGPMRLIGGGTLTDALAGILGPDSPLLNRLGTFSESLASARKV